MQQKQIALAQAKEARPSEPFESGSSIDYSIHMSKFESATDSDAIDAREKLLELAKWFTGAPHMMITALSMNKRDPEGSLKKAKDKLDVLFSLHRDSFVSVIKKVTKGKQITALDHDGHTKLYSELMQAQAMLGVTNNEAEFNRRDIIREIIDTRLDHMSLQFWKEDEKSLREKDKPFDFNDLLNEIEKWLIILTNKGVSEKRHDAGNNNNGNGKNGGNSRQAANVNASSGRGPPKPTTTGGYTGKVGNSPTQPPNTAKCAVCESVHATENCNILLDLSLDNRMLKMREKGLCFYCLEKGHTAKMCPNPRPVCGKCNKPNHHTLIHRGNAFQSSNGLPFQPLAQSQGQNPPPPFAPSTTPATAPESAA